jgi:hypothetical protein
MNTQAIINVSTADINKVTFEVSKSKTPGRIPAVNIKYDGQNIRLRLPKLKFSSGVVVQVDEKSGSKSFKILGSLEGCDPYGKENGPDTPVGKAYNFLNALSEKILTTASNPAVSGKWFGKVRSVEALRDGFKPIVSVSSSKQDGVYTPNGKYPPSVQLKIPVYDNNVTTDVIDNLGNPVAVKPDNLLSVFPKSCVVNPIVSGTIYIMSGGGFGVTLRLENAQVFPQSRLTSRNIFADEIEEPSPADDVAESGLATTKPPSPVQVEAPKFEVPATSDAEESEAEETRPPAPAPAPAPAARRRRAAAS